MVISTLIMSYDTYKSPLTLIPRLSLHLVAFIAGLHSIAVMFVLFFFPAPLVYKFYLIAVIGLSSVYTYRLHIQKQLENSIQQVLLTVDNQWEVTLAKSTERVKAILLPSSMVNRHLVILNFKLCSSKVCTLILAKNAIDRELARKLRTRIRVMGL